MSDTTTYRVAAGLSAASFLLSLHRGDYINTAAIPLFGGLFCKASDPICNEIGSAMIFTSVILAPAAGVGYAVYALGGKTLAIIAGSATAYGAVIKIADVAAKHIIGAVR